MLFGSPTFLYLFLPLLLALYLPAGKRLRNALLLTASLFFYTWGEGGFVLLLVGSVVANYGLGRWVGRRRAAGGSARAAVVAAAVLNIGILAFFKYAHFLWGEMRAVFAWLGVDLPTLREVAEATGLGPLPTDWAIHLPLGISFFTFQAISYVVDAARGQAPVQKRLSGFALYVSLFPQLLAGPIVRYRDVAGQLEERHVRLTDLAVGIRRFTIGLAKKVLIADVLAVPADAAFALEPGRLESGAAWLGLVCFSLQIYYDFTGYSDMAIGLGRMLGFRFRENFRHPYAARSIGEFWRRWHISLSSWFLDYVYFPLLGKRPGRWRPYAALLALFVLSGLWHGASWVMVGPALLHGVFLCLERAGFDQVLERTPRVLRHGYVHLVTLGGWTLFRSPDFAHAGALFGRLIGTGTEASALHYAGLWWNGELAFVLVVAVLGLVPWMPTLNGVRQRWEARGERAGLRLSLHALANVSTALLLLLSLATVSAGTSRPFVYFRF